MIFLIFCKIKQILIYSFIQKHFCLCQ